MAADIFEIVGINAEFKFLDKAYRVRDPKTLDKISWMKALDEFRAQRDNMSQTDAALKDWELQKQYVRLYVPSLTNKDIDNMGQHAFQSLSEIITKLAGEKFGAYVRKIDDQKKSLATPQV